MMKIQRLIVAAIVAATVTTPLHAADGVELLLKSGNVITFLFSERPTLLIGENLTVSCSTRSVAYDYSQVKSLRRANSTDLSRISNVERNHITFRIGENAVEVTGMRPGGRVAIYSTDGRISASAVSEADGTASLPLPEQKGIYIIKAGGNIGYKLIRK